MPHASLVASEILVRSGAMEEMRVVPATIPLAPPFRFQPGPFGLSQYARGLPQNRTLVLVTGVPKTFFRGLIGPPRKRPSTVPSPLLHQPITKAKPRLASMHLVLEARTP